MQRYTPTPREQVEKLLEDTKTSTTKSGKPKKKRTAGHIVASALSTLLIVALLAVLGSLLKTKLEGGYPQLLGYRIFQVETGSMIPTLPIGSFILVKEPDDPLRLSIGDVITYKHETAVVTHRIIDKIGVTNEETGLDELAYVTKGDNPDNSVDPWSVDPEDILGVMIWNVSF